MKTLYLAALAAFALVGVPPFVAPTRHFDSACYPADAYTARQISTLKGIFASTDTLVVAWRQSTVHLLPVADSAIEVVSDSTKCSRALATFNRAVNLGGATATRLYLIRAGVMYVASNPALTPGDGELPSQLVLDSTFAHVATYGR